jgi:hypothetical protein
MKTAKLNTKSNYTYIKSKYNPALDNLKGGIIFKEKFEQAKEILSKTVFPKEVLDIINKEFRK